MAFERRSFAGGGANTTLASGIDGSTDTISITDATGWPTGSGGDFFVVIDLGGSTEEKVRVTSRAGTTLTVATSGRGADGTSGVAHDSGATIALCLAAVDLDEANEHVSDSRSTAHAASKISFDNGDSGLSATNVQDAVDEVVAGQGGLLAYKVHAPSVAESYSIVGSATLTAVDTTDLRLTFTAPGSGAVLVRLSGMAAVGADGIYTWGLLESGSTVGTPCRVLSDTAGGTTAFTRVAAVVAITGLTPGSSHTYDWAHAAGAGNGGFLAAGDADASDSAGPAVMEIWAAPA